MEVKINPQFIVSERERRAWSQQHLADAADLALRTIQRIESRGTGSYESLKSIASCLEVSVENLRAADEVPVREGATRFRSAKVAGSVIGISMLAGIAGFLWLGTASAQRVLVDLGLTIEKVVVADDAKAHKDVQNFRTQLLLGDGEAKELPMEGKFNLVVTPTILESGQVVLSVKLYEHRGSSFEFAGEPRVVASDGKEAEVVFPVGERPERTYRITFKPTLQ